MRARLTGCLLAGLGMGLLLLALEQPARLASGRLGPGFVAQGTAGLLVLVGAAAALLGAPQGQAPAGTFRPAALLLAAIAWFAATLAPLGFLAAAFGASQLAALAPCGARPGAALVTAVVTTAAATLLFAALLGLPLLLWPR